ncbi:hypothetical protein N7516_005213 [Penicillium verrucosum]|uniref:uncharacterized protein n=1 Tax=Penicillium verrucosum TaxID=60171 RepID=UPI002544E3D8|nr:uncharacterized protein N7516_005213 [Penicillium verrucosum]KAJ5945045.1 hypothetical protein N7516_005213 [Penicillium verrucosum]
MAMTAKSTSYHISHDGFWSNRYQDGLNVVTTFLRHGLETSPLHSSVATGGPITFKCWQGLFFS